MTDNLVVMVPDYRGSGLNSQFYEKIQTNVPEGTKILSIFNGVDSNSLDKLLQKSEELGLRGIKCEERGLSPALMAGYRHCIEHHGDSVVVRLDTAEHNPEYLTQLAVAAKQLDGLIVGDLSFKKGGLVENSADELIHLGVFPQLYQQFSGIPLSCAHGYQASSPILLPLIYEGAERIMKTVESETGQFPTWGFDGAMVLSARKQGLPVEIIHVPAMETRNRPTKKIMDQFGKHLLLCRAAERVFE